MPKNLEPLLLDVDRDTMGRLVRYAWVEWAKTQPSPKSSWLEPYDGLSEADKEADRQIGEYLWAKALHHHKITSHEAELRELHRDAALAALSGTAGLFEDGMTDVDLRTLTGNALGIADEFTRQYNPDKLIVEVMG